MRVSGIVSQVSTTYALFPKTFLRADPKRRMKTMSNHRARTSLPNRTRTSDRWMTRVTTLQSIALPTELSGDGEYPR